MTKRRKSQSELPQQCNSLRENVIYLLVKMKLCVHKRSHIPDAVGACDSRSTQFVIKTIMVCFLQKEMTLVLLTLSFTHSEINHNRKLFILDWRNNQLS